MVLKNRYITRCKSLPQDIYSYSSSTEPANQSTGQSNAQLSAPLHDGSLTNASPASQSGASTTDRLRAQPHGRTNAQPTSKINLQELVTTFVAIMSIIALILVAILGDNQSNKAQDELAIMASKSMIIDLPGQGCIPNITNIEKGSTCAPVSFGCNTSAPIYRDFINKDNAIPIWNVLVECNVIHVINIHDETGIINITDSASNIISQFYGMYAISGMPNIYSTIKLKPKAQSYPPLFLDNVIIRLSATDQFNYIWMSLTQNNDSMACLSQSNPLGTAFKSIGCPDMNLYVTAPYCRPYSCTNGIDVDYYSTYANYIAILGSSFKGNFYGQNLSLSNINAIYSGVIGALVAAIVSIVAIIVGIIAATYYQKRE
jgi:hypothetical protein